MLTFTDPIEAAQWGEEFFAANSHHLTEDEVDALRAYKYGAYSLVNRTLRASNGELPLPPLSDVWSQIVDIDTAIAKCLLPPVTLYRGHRLTTEWLKQFDANRFIGTTIWNKGFCSTSLLLEEAYEYYLQHPQESAIFQAGTPLGMEGIYLDVEEIEDLRQYEILLPRDIGWKVVHSECDAANRRIVIAELVRREE